MFFVPLDRMAERVEIARQESESAAFHDLVNFGELIVKLIVAGMVAAIDDVDRSQYSLVHRLVHADGDGEWIKVLDEICVGPTAQHVLPEARDDLRALTQRSSVDTWQHSAVDSLHLALSVLGLSTAEVPPKVYLRRWVSDLVFLRNKTRGHGAQPTGILAQASQPLEHSIQLVVNEYPAFRRSWAHLRRTYKGRYWVSKMTPATSPFDRLTGQYATDHNVILQDGVYVAFGDSLRLVELVKSDPNLIDIFLVNGAARGDKYEWLSYITGSTDQGNLSQYFGMPTPLPSSSTQGDSVLEARGEIWTNTPSAPQGYIAREGLERELLGQLIQQHHPIVTLLGRGGIGKTSLALTVLQSIAQETRFGFVLWFSARDIDLLDNGPKQVKPNILTEQDIARNLIQLFDSIAQTGINPNKPEALRYFGEALTASPFGSDLPILFVFDNFETVRSPQELYSWIDERIRSPNKALITTRFRDFRGDYPVEVGGMRDDECQKLIDSTCVALGIDASLLGDDYRQDLIRESDGHPYVIKILLGEVKKSGRARNVQRIVGGSDEILDALFERTYASLSPVAQRVFLTLCNWKSEVPQLAMEAVLLRPQREERLEVARAVEELRQSSLIEVKESESDGSLFLSAPLVATVFGKRKLEGSPAREAIQEDTEILRTLGAAQHGDISLGISPRVERMFRELARRGSPDDNTWKEYLPILELIAAGHPPAWLLLANLYEDENTSESLQLARLSIHRFLEAGELDGRAVTAWSRLASLSYRLDDLEGEAHALARIGQVPGAPFQVLSDAVSRYNSLFGRGYRLDTDDRRASARVLAQVMARRAEKEGNATDYSRLAWLYMHMKDREAAKRATEIGLAKDPYNDYCYRLYESLK